LKKERDVGYLAYIILWNVVEAPCGRTMWKHHVNISHRLENE
jgi:hypothetical protein